MKLSVGPAVRTVRDIVGVLLVGVACLSASLPSSARTNPKRIAVLEFGNDGTLDESVMVYLADEVREQALKLLDRDEWEVMTRENTLVLLESNAADLASCEGECEVETGRLLGAHLVVGGELVLLGSAYRVRIKAFDTTTGALLSSESVESDSPDGLIEEIREACEALFVAGGRIPQEDDGTSVPRWDDGNPVSRWDNDTPPSNDPKPSEIDEPREVEPGLQPTTAARIDPRKPPKKLSPRQRAGLAIGIGGGVAAFVGWGVNQHMYKTYYWECDDSLYQWARNHGNAGMVLSITGIAAAITGFFLLVIPEKKQRQVGVLPGPTTFVWVQF